MASKKPSRKEGLSPAGQMRPEDGIDSGKLAGKDMPRKGQRKVRQLCAQVAETLSLVLSGEFGDELLRNLQVVAVDPAPDASRLEVTVRAGLRGESINPAEVLTRLDTVMGKLRCEVAAAITRRKAPQLVFRLALD